MIGHDDNIEGIDIIKEVIFSLTHDRKKTAQAFLTVSAEVGGKQIIDEENIDCLFSIQYDSAEINIFWEECGYKGYKALGLFGQMNSKWQHVKRVSSSSFSVSDEQGSYIVTIEY